MFPLDLHAHIEPDIAPAELEALRSCVIAVSRSVGEYESTKKRDDPSVAWAVGCHPGLVREVRRFSKDQMRDAIATTAVIGEIGLDGTSRCPIEDQLAVLRAAFDLATDVPRLMSLHSYRATDVMLQELERFRPRAAILHWWLGSPAETEAAVRAGAYFSINASQARKWSSINVVPLERLFIETDHPFGDRMETQPRRPGNLLVAERSVAGAFGLSSEELRVQTWRNLKSLSEDLDLVELLPRDFQVQFLAL